MDKITLMAIFTFGLEAVVKRELQALGFVDLNVSPGKVEFEATVNDVPIEPVRDVVLAPDGQSILYSLKSSCVNNNCGSDLWQLTLDQSEPKFFLQFPDSQATGLAWAPDGPYLAFTKWKEENLDYYEVNSLRRRLHVPGELWLLDMVNGQQQFISSILTSVSSV